MQGCMKNSRLSTNISLYLGSDTRQSHSYCGMWIGNRTQTFEWYQFQWPSETSNSDFNVTPLFNAEYLRNTTTYRRSYNEIPGTNRDLRPSQACHFECPTMTLSDSAKYSVTRSITRSLRDSWASCSKTEVVISQPSIELSLRNLVCWQTLAFSRQRYHPARNRT